MTKHEKNFFSDFFKKNLGDSLTNNATVPSIYALYDSNSHQFMDPFICPNTDFAKRSVNQIFVNGGKTLITQFPNDFFLYKLGDYNNNNGFVKSDIECICCCSDFYVPISDNATSVSSVSSENKVVELFPSSDCEVDNE